MGSDFWEEFIGLPEEISEEEANKLEKDALVIDLEGEGCPYPQIKTKEALLKVDSGKVVVMYTDHVMAVSAVPNSVKSMVSNIKIWKSGKGKYRLFFWKK